MPSRSLSSYVLLAANLVPLIGVIFYGWDTVLVLALFWIENLIIGLFNVLKMAVLTVYHKDGSGIFLCAFFVVHYGVFCSAHGLLLSDILNFPVIDVSEGFAVYFKTFGSLFLSGAAVLASFVQAFSPFIYLGISALFLSHIVSFIENFILRGEIFDLKANNLIMRPYPQIFIMHVGLLLGAVALQRLGSPVWLLAIIVVAKIVVDSMLFRKRRTTTKGMRVLAKDN